MVADNRRKNILEKLFKAEAPFKGSYLAEIFGVTRQVIVKDIAILRAEGNKIIATPDGYIIEKEDRNKIKKIIAVNHKECDMIKELEIVIKYGGTIEDVIIEHPVYGEIVGKLMIKSINDLNKFDEKYKKYAGKPLSILTNGIHLHTISVDSEENMNYIKKELKDAGFIL